MKFPWAQLVSHHRTRLRTSHRGGSGHRYAKTRSEGLEHVLCASGPAFLPLHARYDIWQDASLGVFTVSCRRCVV